MDRRLVALAVLVVAIVVGAFLLAGGNDPVDDARKDTAASDPTRGTAGPPLTEDEPGPAPPEPAPAPTPIEAEPEREPDPPKERTPRGARAANEAKLDSASVTLRLSETTILDALTAIGEKIGLDLYVHPNIDAGVLGKTISFDFQGASARMVLEFVQKMGLPETEWVVTAEGVELRPK